MSHSSVSPYFRVYDTQPGVTVFQSVWVNEVLEKRCTVYDVPLGQYLVLPHYLVQVYVFSTQFSVKYYEGLRTREV